MNPIKVFNPEHDMALANGDRHFIAPRNIREMSHDLSPLLAFVEGDDLLVWGWDHAIKSHLLRMGIAADLLPSDKALTALRQRSGRATAHHMLAAFHSAHPTGPYIGESTIVRNIDDIPPYASKHGHIVLKDPFSSSGKGLRHVIGDMTIDFEKVRNWIEALIRRHGHLTAEPYYDKEQDFAMEFRADGNGCHFIGYSLFNTNSHGRYESNILASDEKIEALLSQRVSREALHKIQTWIASHTDHIIPTEWDTAKFPLYLGIDMMIVRTMNDVKTDSPNSLYKIHPCIEINLRLNMGIIAHEVRRQLLSPKAEGTFHVTAFLTPEALQAFQIEQKYLHPANYREGHLVSGYHPLTPALPDTRHHAYVLCSDNHNKQ